MAKDSDQASFNFRRILVPIKGSPADDEALRVAVLAARRTRAEIVVVHVVEVKQALPLDAELPDQLEAGEDALDRADALARRLDCEVQTELLQARLAGPAIVDEAIDRGSDLIVMGVQYRVRLGEFNMGKTAPYVLKNSPCRVWLCRLPHSEGAVPA